MSEIINLFAALIGGLGIGSLLTAFVKERFDKKKFIYTEKHAIYAGYLQALSNTISEESTEDSKQQVVYWTTRLKLIAPHSIIAKAEAFFQSDTTGDKFVKLREDLVNNMAEDLKKSL